MRSCTLQRLPRVQAPSTYLHDAQTDYYTASDWLEFRSDTRPLQSKIQRMVDRWTRLGLSNPDEWTFAWGIGIITLSHFPQYPSYKAVHTILEDLKEALHACRKIWTDLGDSRVRTLIPRDSYP